MKLTVLFVVAAFLQAEANISAQNISMHVKQEKIEKVFKEIQKQSGYVIVYNSRFAAQANPVSINADKTDLKEVLRQCFENQPFTYEIQDKIIVVKEKSPVKVVPPTYIPSPPTTIHGKVTNEKGEPVAGVTVTVKGTTNRTSTNDNGEFSLNVADPNSTLVFSAVTIETYETKLNGKNELNIAATTKISQLQEVVVNKGYYSVKQRENTGDVTTVKGEDIRKQPINNPLAALEGRVPGMQIIQNTGMFGGGFSVQIRGKGSIASGTDPLYIIDGVPYASQLITGNNLNPAGGSPLNFINPSDIESIDVLKDADATAIYGSRGANGVVLITTRTGKIGNAKVDINVYTGSGHITRMVDYMNTQQYLQMRKEAFKNDNVLPTITSAPDLLLWDTTRYTNWQNVLIGGTAHYTDAQGSVSGGNSNTQYLIGTSFHRETTVFPGNNSDQKASVHFNINTISNNKKFRIQLSANYISDNNNRQQIDFTSLASNLPPDAPEIFNADGSLNWAPVTPGLAGSWTNPFQNLQLNYKANTSNLIANAVVGYSIIDGLEFKTGLGYTDMGIDEMIIQPTTAMDPGKNPTSGNSYFNATTIRSWIVEPQINYKKRLGKGTINTLIGATLQQNTTAGQYLFATGFSSDALLKNIKNASSVSVQAINNTQYKYSAVFGRLNYEWQGKYFINGTIRRDGSSRFGPDKQFANFGSIGAAWILSKESFSKNIFPILSFGKLRVSYGTSGNDQIPDYQFLDLYSSTSNPYLGTQGLFPNRLFNPNLAWEVNRKFEGGIELGFLNDRININASYYQNRSSNQLINYSLSAVTGFTSIQSNFSAVVQNSGFEIVLNTNNIKTKNFTWTSSFNLTNHHNKLISFPGLTSSSYNSSLIVGEPITISKLYQFGGVNAQTGVYQFIDNKGNLTSSPSSLNDRIYIADRTPKYYGGFQNNFKYKGFELDILFQFVKQTGFSFLYTSLPGKQFNEPVTVINHWQKPGDISNYGQYSQNSASPVSLSNNFVGQSSLYYSDGSFIRLKNLSLSYSLPESWRQRIHMQNCRIYIQGQNLLTITNYVGYDPENQSSTALPPLRILTAGIQITL